MTLQRFLPGQGETILIVDDESVTRLMVRKVLEESDYRVVEAQDGVQALERVQEGMPELILLDVRMPRLNGFDTCRALRQQAQGRHVPILMLTGLDDVVAVQLAFEAGATDFITKPINWALLAQRLRYALHGKQQEDRLRESEARLVHAQRLARRAADGRLQSLDATGLGRQGDVQGQRAVHHGAPDLTSLGHLCDDTAETHPTIRSGVQPPESARSPWLPTFPVVRLPRHWNHRHVWPVYGAY